jgi:hypothetical protein
MPLNGASAKTGAALSCRKRLVAQCFEPDFGYGTVAAKFKNKLPYTLVVSLFHSF